MTNIMQITLTGKDYVSTDFLVKMLGLSRRTVTLYHQRGLFPMPIRIGRSCYYDRQEVEKRLTGKV